MTDPMTDPMTGPTTDRRGRELTGVLLWAVAAVAWVVAMFVPWYAAGVAGATTPMEIGGLVRGGVLGIPESSAYAVLVPPTIALLLLGIAPLRGGGVMALRVLLWLVGTVIGIGLVVVLGSVSAYAVGPGAALVVLASVLGGVALGCATVRVPTRTGWAGPPAGG